MESVDKTPPPPRGACNVCTDKLVYRKLTFSGGAETPLEWRCQNESCPAHRDPAYMQEHASMLRAAVERSKVEDKRVDLKKAETGTNHKPPTAPKTRNRVEVK